MHEGTKTYRGSCHCGAVRYEVELDLSEGTTQCNCSICSKRGWWGRIVKPAAFRLVSGEARVTHFLRNPMGEQSVCTTCGIAPFSNGNLPVLGGEYYSVNVRCLDGVDLAGVPVRYLDGRHDTWATIREKPWDDPFAGAGAPHLRPMWEAGGAS